MHHKIWVCPDPECKSIKFMDEKYCEGWVDEGGQYRHSRIEYIDAYQQESFYNRLLGSTVWLQLFTRNTVSSDITEEDREKELRQYVRESTIARGVVEQNLKHLEAEVELLRKILSS